MHVMKTSKGAHPFHLEFAVCVCLFAVFLFAIAY